MNRRSLLGALGLALVAPAVIRTPGLLMPIQPQPSRLAVQRGPDGEWLEGFLPRQILLCVKGQTALHMSPAEFRQRIGRWPAAPVIEYGTVENLVSAVFFPRQHALRYPRLTLEDVIREDRARVARA